MSTALDNAIDSLAGLSGIAGVEIEEVLNGYLGKLVAGGKMTKETALKVKRVTNATVRGKMLKGTFGREQNFLLSQTPKLKEQIKKDIAEGRNLWDMFHLYKAVQVTGAGGSFDLMKPDEAIRVGICNISDRKLPNATAMALGKIKFSYGFLADVVAAATDPARAMYTNAMDAETAGSSPVVIPPAILNGELEIIIGSVSRIRLPLRRFFREGLSAGIAVEGQFDCVVLDSPILIQGGEDIRPVLHFAEGQTITSNATNNHFVRIDMHGVGVSPK